MIPTSICFSLPLEVRAADGVAASSPVQPVMRPNTLSMFQDRFLPVFFLHLPLLLLNCQLILFAIP